MSRINRRSLKDTALVLGTAVALAGTAALPAAVAQAADTPTQLAACNPCNPCNPCNAKCGAKCGAQCNPCAATNPCGANNACNPCGGKCNPCNPCASKKN